MTFPFKHWLRQLLQQTPRHSTRRRPTQVRWGSDIQILEHRVLLSATNVAPFASPAFVHNNAGYGVESLAVSSPTGYTPAKIRQAYAIGSITLSGGTVAGDGSGTTIAIVDAYNDPNIASDLHNFNLKFGLPDSGFTKVDQNGGTAYPVANAAWITEIALDVQWAHAIAPKANILLVEANSNSFSDLFKAVDYARNVPGVVAVSMSWGSGEFSFETAYDSYLTTPAGHGGVTFLASSGDTGSPAMYPSSSPNVVSSGGTGLQLDSAGNWKSETGISFSGGGVSSVEMQPIYQNGIVTQSSTHRATPDIAFAASGFSIYDSYNNGSVLPWTNVSGTSACAPQLAGLIAIADQGRLLAGKGALDGATQTLPALYSFSTSDFHDVISGSSIGTPNLSAAPGYDMVTGRGSPLVSLLIPQLVGPTSAIPDIRVISATADGKTTFSLTYAIDNTAVTTPFDVSVSRSNNTALGGATLLSTVTISAADDLSLGTHTKTFTIGNGPGQIALPGAGSAEIAQDYYLLAVVNSTNTVTETNSSNNMAVFAGVYHASHGAVYVQGTAGADSITVSGWLNVNVNGTPYAYSTADVTGVTVRGHEGDDVIDASSSSMALTAYGGAGNDMIKGGSAADILNGGTGTNTLSGGNGNDTYVIAPRTVVGTDTDTLITGTGANTLSMTSFTNDLSLNLQATVAQTVDPVTGGRLDLTNAKLTTVLLGSGNDNVTGNATMGTYIDGGAGNNTLTGGTGNDTLIGGNGNDTLIGGGGNDSFNGGTGNNLLNGSAAGNDAYTFTQRTVAGSDQDTVIGNTTGVNTLSFTTFTNGLTLSLQATGAQLADAVTGYRLDVSIGLFKTINLGSGNDIATGNATIGTNINGGNGNNTLTGGSGNDVLTGGSGNDTLIGMGGNDSFNGGTGTNVLNGSGLGNDTYIFAPRTVAGSDQDSVVGNTTGANTLSFTTFKNGLTLSLQATGAQLADAVTGYRLDVSIGLFKTINLGSGNDIATGNATIGTTINGGNGNNTLTGGSGNDVLTGGSGNDTLIGMGGNDWFNGGTGTNVLNGSGSGNATYNFAPRTVAGSDQDTVVGNTIGLNTLSFSAFKNGLTFSLQATGAQLADAVTGYQLDVSTGLFRTIKLGSGNDFVTGNAAVGTYIYGAGGNNILIGGSGNDTLIGGTGQDILIGGFGVDNLQGNGGGDILIGGTLSFSNNPAAMLAIQNEWTSTDSYDVRVANLRGPSTSGMGLNGTTYLSSLTVTLNTVKETLLGGTSGDWFWANTLSTTNRVTSGSFAEFLN